MYGQTVITYGDVSIFNVTTRRFHQENVYDESQGHVMYQKTTIEVSGLLHGNYQTQRLDHSMGRIAGHPAGSHRQLRARLFKPRRAFAMRVGCESDGTGGTVLFECLASRSPEEGGSVGEYSDPNGVDLNNGPKVSNISITHVASNETFAISCTFEICKRECDPTGGGGSADNPVKSLTWSVEDDIDQNFTTTRSYHGRLIANNSNLNLNSLRGYVVPPLLPGMMRRSMRFAVDRTRLVLDFSIVDREVHYSPPAPATSWAMTHRIETGDNLERYGFCDVTLAGPRDVSKAALIQLGIYIVRAKLYRLVNHFDAKPVITEHFAITDSYSDDSSNVQVSARVKYVGDSLDEDLQHILGEMGKPLDASYEGLDGYDYRFSAGSVERSGSTPLEGPISRYGAIVAAFGEACGAIRGLGALSRAYERKPIRGGGEDPGESGEEDADVEIVEVSTLPATPPSYYSQGHVESIYTHWQMETLYDTDEGVVALPIAEQSSQSSQTRDTTRFVRVAPASTKRTVRVEGERAGTWPTFPKSERFTDANGIEIVPLATRIKGRTHTIAADGTKVYKAGIEYVQGLSRAPEPTEMLTVGYNPWDSFGMQGIPPLAFDQTLNVAPTEG